MTIVAPHLRQRILASLSVTFSSAIEYLALQAGQEIFTGYLPRVIPTLLRVVGGSFFRDIIRRYERLTRTISGFPDYRSVRLACFIIDRAERYRIQRIGF